MEISKREGGTKDACVDVIDATFAL